jgi:hypothetical protein
VSLSAESRSLLAIEPRTEREGVRLNQSLLEDAFPEEVKFRTLERDLIDEYVSALRPFAGLPLTVETILELGVVALLEVGCQEQFGWAILKRLNSRVLDEVHGPIVVENNSIDLLVARLIQRGDGDAFSKELRRRTGIVECLLYWYGYSREQAARQIVALNPKQAEVKVKKSFGAAVVDHEESWAKMKTIYQGVLEEIYGGGGQEISEAQFSEAKISEAIDRQIERLVIAHLADAYGWTLREEML